MLVSYSSLLRCDVLFVVGAGTIVVISLGVHIHNVPNLYLRSQSASSHASASPRRPRSNGRYSAVLLGLLIRCTVASTNSRSKYVFGSENPFKPVFWSYKASTPNISITKYLNRRAHTVSFFKIAKNAVIRQSTAVFRRFH